MYQLEIYNHFSLQTTRWHSKNLPYVHFEFLGLKKNLLWTTAAGYRLRLTYTQDERGLKMEITVFLLRSQICQSESLCQTDPIFKKSTVKLGLTHKSYSVQIYRINSYFPRHFPKVFLILRKQNRKVLYTRQVHTLLFNPLCVYFSTYEGLFI